MTLLEEYRAFGEDLEQRWGDQNFNERLFPALAESALRGAHLYRNFSVSLLVDEVLAAQSSDLLPQYDLQSSFGEPPLTVYTGRRFYIAVNLWLNASIAVHEHAFAGAFQVLQGSSFHSGYSFREEREINSRLRIGSTKMHELSILRPGDVCRILPADQGAHRLFHIESPSATLVVRTRGEHLSSQYTYLPPSIAYDPFYLGGAEDTVAFRRRELLTLLGATDFERFRSALVKYLGTCEGSTAFQTVMSSLKLLVDNADSTTVEAALDEVLQPIAHRDAGFADALRAAALETIWSSNILHRRESIRGHDERYLFAVLLNAPDRSSVLRLISQRWPDCDPVSMVITLVDSLASRKDPDDPSLTLLGLEPDAVVVLREMIARPGAVSAVLRAVGGIVGEDVVRASYADLVALYEILCTRSPFRPLFQI